MVSQSYFVGIGALSAGLLFFVGYSRSGWWGSLSMFQQKVEVEDLPRYDLSSFGLQIMVLAYDLLIANHNGALHNTPVASLSY